MTDPVPSTKVVEARKGQASATAAKKGGSGGSGKKDASASKPSYPTRAERAKTQLAKIVELFSTKELPDTLAKSYLKPTGSPSDKWSLGNRLIMTTEKTYDARGYRQWQSVGRHVRKGSKAIYILAPRIGRTTEKDKETGKEVERTFVAGFLAVPVFRYEDTDGAEIKTVKNAPRSLPPLADVARKWGIKVRFDATRCGEYGSFSKSESEIRLCTDDTSTFFHELAHAAHSRFEDLKPGQDSAQEIIAQLSACTLARMYGYDVDGYTYGYISYYTSGGDPETVGRSCYRVIGKVEKVLSLILDAKEESEAERKEQRQRRRSKDAEGADGGIIPPAPIASDGGGDAA